MTYLALALPTAGPVVNALSTMSKFLGIAASMAVVGALLAMGFLLEDEQGKISEPALPIRKVIEWAAGIWAIASAANILLTLANILGEPITSVFDVTTVRSFILQVTLGQFLFFQLLVALFLAAVALRIKMVSSAILLLALALIGIVAPIFQSHSATGGSHSLAIGSLLIHVVALSLWVGGVFALAILEPKERAIATSRFTSLALWAAIAVVVSGVANAWIRLNFSEAWRSSYAVVIILKVILTIILIYIGYSHRKNLVKAKINAMNWSRFAQLILLELSIMVVALALGAWLSNSPPPISKSEAFNAAVTITGLTMPATPNVQRLVTTFDPDAIFLGILILGTALYIRGISILKKRGDSWPLSRTIAFGCGIAAINFATSGGIGVYAHFAFSFHMIAHMILGMIAPIAIVLGAPITLALRTLPQGRSPGERGIRGTIILALHSRITGFFVNPIVALLIFDGSLFALYFTSLFGGMMQSDLGHLVMNIHFILAGLLFFHVIIGVDPNPRRVPYLARIVLLFVAMSIHAFFSVALMSSSTLLDGGYFGQLHRPWWSDLLIDQRLAGSIGWAMGEVPILFALIATFTLWIRDDSREAKRSDRNSERLRSAGVPDELAKYNDYLASLARKSESRE